MGIDMDKYDVVVMWTEGGQVAPPEGGKEWMLAQITPIVHNMSESSRGAVCLVFKRTKS